MQPDDLRRRGGAVQIVDVRWPNEWQAGHIDGAIHVREDEVDDRLDEIDGRRPIVTVCRTGTRSARVAASLEAEGYGVVSLDGGLLAWVAAGLPLVDGEGRPGRIVDPEPPADDRPESQQRLQREFLDVLFAVQERFGETEPPEADVRAFLRDRLIGEGRSPEDADAFMAALDEPR